MQCLVDGNAGGNTARRGTQRDTACRNGAAEQGRHAGVDIHELNRAGPRFGNYGNSQDTIESNGARRGARWQCQQRRSCIGLIGIPVIRNDRDVRVTGGWRSVVLFTLTG